MLLSTCGRAHPTGMAPDCHHVWMQTSFEFPFIAALAPQSCASHEIPNDASPGACIAIVAVSRSRRMIPRHRGAGGRFSLECRTVPHGAIGAYDVDAAGDAKSD